tara:strand:- start:86 stop:691 length:606 start_codon:yes stop_codon:yes gene_type:complete
MNSQYQTVKKSGDNTYSYKVVLLGESSVGKTSFTNKFTRDQFDKFQESTIGAAYSSKMIEDGDDMIRFEIWDTAGQERYHALAPMYYRGARAAIIMFDITSNNSFFKARDWIDEIEEACNNIYIILVGNKLDLEDSRQVNKELVRDYAYDKGIQYIESSAKEGHNITDTFKIISDNLPRDDQALISRNFEVINPNPRKKCC